MTYPLVASAWGWLKLALLVGAIVLWWAVPVWLVVSFADRHGVRFRGLAALLFVLGLPLALVVLVRALRSREPVGR